MVPFKLWEQQRADLRDEWFYAETTGQPLRKAVKKSREIGETAKNAARYLLKAIAYGGNVFNVADTRDHAVTNLKYHDWFLRGMEQHGITFRRGKWNETQLELPDVGVEIRALPCTASAGLSFRCRWLHLTEVHRWGANAWEVYGAVTGAHAPGGEIVAEGAGCVETSGLWKELTAALRDGTGYAGWNVYDERDWTVNPNHTEQWAQLKRDSMPDWVWRVEYCCEDGTPGMPYFGAEHDLDGSLARGRALLDEVLALEDGAALADWYEQHGTNPTIYTGMDTAEGHPDGDASALCCVDGYGLERASGAGQWSPEMLVDNTYHVLDELERAGYEIIAPAPESNSWGRATVDAINRHPLWRFGVCRERRAKGGTRAGVWNDPGAKKLWFSATERDLRAGLLHLTNPSTRTELARVQAATLRAPTGEHDDRAIALLIANHRRRTVDGRVLVG